MLLETFHLNVKVEFSPYGEYGETKDCPREGNECEMHFFNVITHRYQWFNNRAKSGAKSLHFLSLRMKLTLLCSKYLISFNFFCSPTALPILSSRTIIHWSHNHNLNYFILFWKLAHGITHSQLHTRTLGKEKKIH